MEIIHGLDKSSFGGLMGLSVRLKRSGEQKGGTEVGKKSITYSLEFCCQGEQNQGMEAGGECGAKGHIFYDDMSNDVVCANMKRPVTIINYVADVTFKTNHALSHLILAEIL